MGPKVEWRDVRPLSASNRGRRRNYLPDGSSIHAAGASKDKDCPVNDDGAGVEVSDGGRPVE
jgi:hypothetical protein